MPSKLRKDSVVPLVGAEADTLPNMSKLPIVRDVLRVFFCHMRGKHSARHGARTAAKLVKDVWSNTKIPSIQVIRVTEKIEALHQEWRGVFKNPSSPPSQSEPGQDLKSLFENKLDALFDISKSDAMEEMQRSRALAPKCDASFWEDQMLFLQDQRGLRLLSLGGADSKMEKLEREREKAEERRIKRLLEADRRKRKEEERANSSGILCELEDSHDEDSDEPSRPKRGRTNVLTPEIVEVLDVAQLSNARAAKVLAASFGAATGKSVSETNINKSTIHREREKQRSTSADSVRDNFHESADSVLTVHWDAKIVETLFDGNESNERLAIIVTGASSTQLLGAPVVANGTAQVAKTAVVQHLRDWHLVDKVKAMSFDTPPVNTGIIGGAALLIAMELGKDMLWCPCRHHVDERVLEGVFREIFGPSTGPNTPLFLKLRVKWKELNKTQYCTFKSYAASRTALAPCADEIILFATTQIQAGQPRGDYLEFLELVIMYLGGPAPQRRRPIQGKATCAFRPPGPIHSARWMATALYAIKMTMFRKQLKLNQTEANGLLKVTIFVVRCYVVQWFSAPHAVAAPKNDLKFLKTLIEYESVDKRVAVAARNKFLNHLWYLSEKSLGLSVFDSTLPDEERRRIADNILHREGPEDPMKRLVLKIEEVPNLNLSDLASRNTQKFFNMLGIGMDFLRSPVVDWESSQVYQEGLVIARNLAVVNDHAERSVKLFSDYNRTVTKKEESFQNLLLNVHSHRQSMPNVKKDTLIKKYQK